MAALSIMDVQMPEMDAYQSTRKICENSRYSEMNINNPRQILPWLLMALFLLPMWVQAPSASQSAPRKIVVYTPEEKIWLEKHPLIDIGVDGNWPPIDFMDRQGEHSGIAGDYLRLIGSRLGVKFRINSGSTFKQMLTKVRRGELKAAASVVKNEERSRDLYFTAPFFTVLKVIVVRKETAGIRNLRDLYGKTVAIEDGFSTMKQLEKHSEIRLKPAGSTQAALKAVSWHEADAYVGTRAVAQWLIQEEQLTNLKFSGDPGFKPAPQRFAVHKDPAWKLLAGILDKTLAGISEKEHRAIIRRWIFVSDGRGQMSFTKLQLSEEERAWLAAHANLRLGIDPNWPPMEFIDEQGRYQGISSRYIHRLSQLLEVEMTPVAGLTWEQVIEKAKAGEIDLLPAVVKTPQRQRYLHFTKPYVNFPFVVFVRENKPFIAGLEDLSGKKVAVEKAYATQEYLEQNHPRLKLLLVANAREGLTKVSLGEVDAYVGNLAVGSHIIDRHGLSNVKVGAPTPYSSDQSIGVRKDWPELVPILEKALASLPAEEKAKIRQEWLAIRYDIGVNYALLWKVSGAALLILALALLWLAQMRKQKEALRVAKEEAEQANRFKSYFLANMSHEIRTPMNAITGLTRLAMKTELTDKQRNYLKQIDSSSHALLGVINDILDFSKIEAGMLDMESIDFHLDEVLDDLSALLGTRIEEKGLKLVLDISTDMPRSLTGDPLRLGQILVNFTANAVKFTEKGKITISAELAEQQGEEVTLRFSVRDTGIGIPPDKITGLFDAFAQADETTSRRFGGTGLGLTICSRLAAMMGGEIRVDSQPGLGSTFSFSAPFGRRADEPAGSRRRKDASVPEEIMLGIRGARILLAEDNKINQQVARETLEGADLLVEIANNGKEATTMLADKIPSSLNEKLTYFDAVLMDVQMPEMDGYQATRKIRENPRYGELPVIAMTAHAMNHDRERCFKAGMNDYVSKPIAVEQLFRVLGKWIKPGKRDFYLPEEEKEIFTEEILPDKLPGIDVESALKRLNGNKKLLKKLLKEFQRDYLHAAHEIRAALAQKDSVREIRTMPEPKNSEKARRLVHTLKGVAGNLSARELQDAALELENAIKQENRNEYEVLLEKLEFSLARLLDTVQNLEEQEAPPSEKNRPVADSAEITPLLNELATLIQKSSTRAEDLLAAVKERIGGAGVDGELKQMEACLSIFDFKGAQIPLNAIARTLGISFQEETPQ
ncbi:MAG: transporter substrate-binding domain-containing protein [Gammaproteobacteria bacterium]|nr:transporter substrate-binding domain-containing protein [Gammaproteobacteria bacterium]